MNKKDRIQVGIFPATHCDPRFVIKIVGKGYISRYRMSGDMLLEKDIDSAKQYDYDGMLKEVEVLTKHNKIIQIQNIDP